MSTAEARQAIRFGFLPPSGDAAAFADIAALGGSLFRDAKAVLDRESVIASNTALSVARDVLGEVTFDRAWGGAVEQAALVRPWEAFNPHHVPGGVPEGGQFTTGTPAVDMAAVGQPGRDAAASLKSTWTKNFNALAEEIGIDPEALRPQLDAQVQDIAKRSDVFVRVTPKVLRRVLVSERLKSQFETQTSGGVLDEEYRARFEDDFFGYPMDTKARERPIYGYFTDDVEKGSLHSASDAVLDHYGSVALHLKEDVEDRTTITSTDTLGTPIGFQAAEPMRNPTALAVHWGGRPRTLLAGSKFLDKAPRDLVHAGDLSVLYTEAQIHGGVRKSDIREVLFYDRDEYENNAPRLHSEGIPARFVEGMQGERVAEPERKAAALIPPKFPDGKLVAQRAGDDVWLFDVGDGMGVVVQNGKPPGTPLPLPSIIARGYWEPVAPSKPKASARPWEQAAFWAFNPHHKPSGPGGGQFTTGPSGPSLGAPLAEHEHELNQLKQLQPTELSPEDPRQRVLFDPSQLTREQIDALDKSYNQRQAFDPNAWSDRGRLDAWQEYDDAVEMSLEDKGLSAIDRHPGETLEEHADRKLRMTWREHVDNLSEEEQQIAEDAGRAVHWETDDNGFYDVEALDAWRDYDRSFDDLTQAPGESDADFEDRQARSNYREENDSTQQSLDDAEAEAKAEAKAKEEEESASSGDGEQWGSEGGDVVALDSGFEAAVRLSSRADVALEDQGVTAEQALELAGLHGYPPDWKADVYIKDYGDGFNMTISVFDDEGKVGEMERTFHPKGFVASPTMEIHNDRFFLSDRAPRGTGAKVFAAQVDAATEAGWQSISVYAARGHKMNGYYTWPRFGYEGRIDEATESAGGDSSDFFDAVDEAGLPRPTHFSDAMENKETRDLWQEHGVGANLEFDLTPHSESHQRLDGYMKENGYETAKSHAFASSKPETTTSAAPESRTIEPPAPPPESTSPAPESKVLAPVEPAAPSAPAPKSKPIKPGKPASKTKAAARAWEWVPRRWEAYDPDQPRAPKGDPDGGKWVPAGRSPGLSAPLSEHESELSQLKSLQPNEPTQDDPNQKTLFDPETPGGVPWNQLTQEQQDKILETRNEKRQFEPDAWSGKDRLDAWEEYDHAVEDSLDEKGLGANDRHPGESPEDFADRKLRTEWRDRLELSFSDEEQQTVEAAGRAVDWETNNDGFYDPEALDAWKDYDESFDDMSRAPGESVDDFTDRKVRDDYRQANVEYQQSLDDESNDEGGSYSSDYEDDPTHDLGEENSAAVYESASRSEKQHLKDYKHNSAVFEREALRNAEVTSQADAAVSKGNVPADLELWRGLRMDESFFEEGNSTLVGKTINDATWSSWSHEEEIARNFMRDTHTMRGQEVLLHITSTPDNLHGVYLDAHFNGIGAVEKEWMLPRGLEMKIVNAHTPGGGGNYDYVQLDVEIVRTHDHDFSPTSHESGGPSAGDVSESVEHDAPRSRVLEPAPPPVSSAPAPESKILAPVEPAAPSAPAPESKLIEPGAPPKASARPWEQVRLPRWEAFNPHHTPGGSPEGGQFTTGDGSFGPTTDAARFIELRNASKHPGFLSPLSVDDLAGHEMHLGHGGKVGFVLDEHGDIQNLFNNGGPKGAGVDAMVQAVAKGGRTLDAFDGFLPKLYSELGFVETGRMKFDPDHAPKGWDYAKDDNPDVVFMGWGGGDRVTPEARARAKDKEAPGWGARSKSGRYYNGDQWDDAKRDSRERARAGKVSAMVTSLMPEERPPDEWFAQWTDPQRELLEVMARTEGWAWTKRLAHVIVKQAENIGEI